MITNPYKRKKPQGSANTPQYEQIKQKGIVKVAATSKTSAKRQHPTPASAASIIASNVSTYTSPNSKNTKQHTNGTNIKSGGVKAAEAKTLPLKARLKRQLRDLQRDAEQRKLSASCQSVLCNKNDVVIGPSSSVAVTSSPDASMVKRTSKVGAVTPSPSSTDAARKCSQYGGVRARQEDEKEHIMPAPRNQYTSALLSPPASACSCPNISASTANSTQSTNTIIVPENHNVHEQQQQQQQQQQNYVCHDPIMQGGPYASTHMVLPHLVTIWRPAFSCPTYGMQFQLEKRQFGPQWGVIAVSKPYTAAYCIDDTAMSSMLRPFALQAGDIILAVNGCSVGGLTVAQVAQLFSSSGTSHYYNNQQHQQQHQYNGTTIVSDPRIYPHEPICVCHLVVARHRSLLQAAASAKMRICVTVPLGSKTGDCIYVQCPDGNTVATNIPVGMISGSTFVVELDRSKSCFHYNGAGGSSSSLLDIMNMSRWDARDPPLLSQTGHINDIQIPARKSTCSAKKTFLPLSGGASSALSARKEEVHTSITSCISTPPPVSAQQSLKMVPFIVDSKSGKVSSGEFTERECLALIHGVKKVGKRWARIKELPACKDALSLRTAQHLLAKWNHAVAKLEVDLQMKAVAHWQRKWRDECRSRADGHGTHYAVMTEYWTDAKRAEARSAPRPSTGCKCGLVDHQRVNHYLCILYRDIASLNHEESVHVERSDISRTEDVVWQSNVADAEKERSRRSKLEADQDLKEALFVEEMEDAQLRGGTAVFAPSLRIMVLSAICALDDTVCESSSQSNSSQNKRKSLNDIDDAHDDDDADDDDDDVPLTVFAAKVHNSRISIADVLLFLSKTWGHVYREPSHNEYSWHRILNILARDNTCDDGSNGWGAGRPFVRNPRNPSTLSFENCQFLLDGETMARLQNAALERNNHLQDDFAVGSTQMSQTTKDDLMLTELVSSSKTGLQEEINVMCKVGLIEYGAEKGLSLKSGWQYCVDFEILNDLAADKSNRYLIHEKLKSRLKEAWEQTRKGWMKSGAGKVTFAHMRSRKLKRKFMLDYDKFFSVEDGVESFGI